MRLRQPKPHGISVVLPRRLSVDLGIADVIITTVSNMRRTKRQTTVAQLFTSAWVQLNLISPNPHAEVPDF